MKTYLTQLLPIHISFPALRIVRLLSLLLIFSMGIVTPMSVDASAFNRSTTRNSADFSAAYRVVFESTWSQISHPHPNGGESFPANAHFSPLIGATHSISATFWSDGALASPGIEQMAETGATALLHNEFRNAGGAVAAIISAAGLSSTPGSVQAAPFTTDRQHPYVTLVSMIAPSPDWFVGVSALSLLDENGNWRDNVQVTLYPYDAGSDDGSDYRSADLEPETHHAITAMQGMTPFSQEPIGVFTFTRLRTVHLPVIVQP